MAHDQFLLILALMAFAVRIIVLQNRRLNRLEDKMGEVVDKSNEWIIRLKAILWKRNSE